MTTTTNVVRGTIAALALVTIAVASSCAVLPVPPPPPGPAPVASGVTVTYDGAGPDVPRIGLIGDSTMASIRWSGAYGPLQRWNFTYDAEACRRTITVSCHGADGYTPANAVGVMDGRLHGRLGTVLVMMVGANDPLARFGEGVDAVVAAAQAQGIANVIWLTVHGAPGANDVLAQRAQQYGGYLVVADWAGYSDPHPEWTNPDRLHVNAAGAAALSQFIADRVAEVLATAPAGA